MPRISSRYFLFTVFCAIFLIVGSTYSQWIKTFGFNLDDRPTAMATDDQGNVYVTGYVTSGTGNVDFCTIKYNSEGVPQWSSAATYNGPGNGEDRAFGIVVDNSGDVIVTGYSTGVGSQSDYTTIKYRGNDGQQLWINRYNTPVNGEDRAFGIVVDRINNVYVTGYITQIGTGNDIYTMKLKSPDGQTIWGQTIINPNINSEDRAFGIVVDSIGENIYLCGYMQDDTTGFDFTVASYDSTGTQRWVSKYNGPANQNDRAFGIVVDQLGNNIYATGFSTFDTLIGTDYTTIRYNNDGDTTWIAKYNGSGNSSDRAFGIVVDTDGNSYVTGYSTGIGTKTDYLTIRYNVGGDTAWTRRFGEEGLGNFSDTAYSIYFEKNSEEVFITGGCASDSIPGKLDIVTLKYNIQNGTQVQKSIYNGPDSKNDVGIAVTADIEGNVFMAGYTETNSNGSEWLTRRYEEGNLIRVNMISTEVPQNFRLYQNYPNPFNPSTTIKFDVQKAAKVRMVVYDVLGREAAVLVNESMKVGSYEVLFSTTKLASGVYFYKLTADDYKEIKKMVLIK